MLINRNDNHLYFSKEKKKICHFSEKFFFTVNTSLLKTLKKPKSNKQKMSLKKHSKPEEIIYFEDLTLCPGLTHKQNQDDCRQISLSLYNTPIKKEIPWKINHNSRNIVRSLNSSRHVCEDLIKHEDHLYIEIKKIQSHMDELIISIVDLESQKRVLGYQKDIIQDQVKLLKKTADDRKEELDKIIKESETKVKIYLNQAKKIVKEVCILLFIYYVFYIFTYRSFLLLLIKCPRYFAYK